MKSLLLLMLFAVNQGSETPSHDCASFYESQLSGILIDSKITKVENAADHFLIRYGDGTEEVLRLLKDKIGLTIFSNAQVGDRLLKNKKEFIGFAIVKLDSQDEIITISTYEDLCPKF